MTTQLKQPCQHQWPQKTLSSSLKRLISPGSAPLIELSSPENPPIKPPAYPSKGNQASTPPLNETNKIIMSNQTFLHSERIKRSLNECRKAFLEGSIETPSSDSSTIGGSEDAEEPQAEAEDTPEAREENLDSLGGLSVISDAEQRNRKAPSRKISFKIKRNVGLSRRTSGVGGKNITTYSANTVAQLTLKFNRMVEENNAILEEPKFAKLVKRVNSQKKAHVNQDSDRSSAAVVVARKPSVKRHASVKSASKHKSSVSKLSQRVSSDSKSDSSGSSSNKFSTCVKISCKDIPERLLNLEDKDRGSIVTATPAIVLPKSTGSVRATIERFERQTSKEKLNEAEAAPSAFPKIAQKPKVPEKTVTMKTKNLVIKDGVRKFKIYEKRPLAFSTTRIEPKVNDVDLESSPSTSLEVEELNSSIPEIIVTNTTTCSSAPTYTSVRISQADSNKKTYQTVISINRPETEDAVPDIPPPKLPSRNAKSVYEPMTYRTPPLPPVLKLAKSEEVLSLSEIASRSQAPEITAKPNTSFLWRRQTSKEYELSQSNTSLASSEKTDKESAPYSGLYKILTADKLPEEHEELQYSWKDLYDVVDPTLPAVLGALHDTSPKVDDPQSAAPSPPERPSSIAKPPLSAFLKNNVPPIPVGTFKQAKPLPEEPQQLSEDEEVDKMEETVYEDVRNDYSEVRYEEVDSKSDDGYEICASPTPTAFEEVLYEPLRSPRGGTLEPPSPPRQEKSSPGPEVPRRPSQPLPPRPVSFYGSEIACNESNVSNCYESIYNASVVTVTTTSAVNVVDVNKVTSSSHDNVSSLVTEGNYESIYGLHIGGLKKGDRWSVSSNRDSTISFDQQSNSLYGRSIRGWTPSPNSENAYGGVGGGMGDGRAGSDFSSSDKSDDWVDVSDPEDDGKQTGGGFVIVRERLKNKRSLGWSKNVRDQFNKSSSGRIQDDPGGFGDDDHHYESLRSMRAQESLEDDYDSFDNDTDSELSYNNANQNDSGVDMGNSQLPEPPGGGNLYGIGRLAKHMKKLRRNWSTTKNDITQSLVRMTKKKSRTDLDKIDNSKNDKSGGPTSPMFLKPSRPAPIAPMQMGLDIPTSDSSFRSGSSKNSSSPTTYINVQYPVQSPEENNSAKEREQPVKDNKEHDSKNTLSKKKYWPKFRRSMSISEPRTVSNTNNQMSQQMSQKPKSTFYLTDTVDADTGLNVFSDEIKGSADNMATLGSTNKKQRPSSVIPMRPQSPPPPAPTLDATTIKTVVELKNRNNRKSSSSWYTTDSEAYKADENVLNSSNERNSNGSTCWYAEIGLYQSNSTPSTSSAENSGNALQISDDIEYKHPIFVASIEDVHNDHYYNLKNGKLHENSTFHVDWRKDNYKSFESNHSGDTLLCLQDEPLYQFYNDEVANKAVKEDGSDSDDYDGYEEIGNQDDSGISMLQTRPSAMQLVLPKKPGAPNSRTLWSEIPEVIQSGILSALSMQQKKKQEAKFEIVTSEASYLNSLDMLEKHFISNPKFSDLLSEEERDILFGKVESVKECSKNLLGNLEACWQDNILLSGIADVLQWHVKNKFSAYVSYCQNQVIIDHTLRKLKERPHVKDMLRQLEQPHSLYSFLMLPMQRVTRLPLLVDAVLRRVPPEDDEYVACQRALATVNEVVKQCNDAARKAEQQIEIKTLAHQIEFPKHMIPFKIENNDRWLVKSGPLTQLQARHEETKLTFGKRLNKVQLHLFLFNDLLVITKAKGDDNYVVQHYCSRSFIELTPTDTLTQLPVKDTQGRHLLFLAILENHERKTVEMLLSCATESDRVRWYEALSGPVSENPDETLYDDWDCPQVRVTNSYVPTQPDELVLNKGDVINVTRKLVDGWYYGEKITDRQTGWFPENHTMEIANPHVRARHLKQRHRFLNYTVSCYNKPPR